ncbi:hypothetical protein NQ317_002334 [Molorchus minor]|uniref:PKS/mFAS DH domain-containing protein n=1 Tax=Molorchus minor TaxID=1323400 RepID=A0ABQ9J0R9_9CUCU|nr:hypothetical protein NQ317_002334 [Molorchus minor]
MFVTELPSASFANKTAASPHSDSGTKVLPDEEVVISGLSGAFPDSRNVHEFRDHLFNKDNMVTPNRRWDDFHPEIPKYAGTIPDVTKFDTGFFARLVLEKTVEAIFDAGLHPSDLEEKSPGDTPYTSSTEEQPKFSYSRSNFQQNHAPRSMIAHRISYFLKLKGPSFIADRLAAAPLCVGGVLSKNSFSKYSNVLQMDTQGRKQEVVIILQKIKDAKGYTQVVHAKSVGDGYKERGVNSFGFGGANCHVLLQTRAKRKINKGIPSDNLPRLVCLSGRTEEAVKCLCEEISVNALDLEYIRLLHDVFRFQDCISRKGINILEALQNNKELVLDEIIMGSLAVQTGISDMLKLLEIRASVYLGYSFGKLVADYSNGNLNLNDVVNCGLIISECINMGIDQNLIDFLQTIGSLYVCGYNPQIKELYPSVKLPVSRETRMISPFIKWRHDRDFFVAKFDKTAQTKERVRQVFVMYTFSAYDYLRGHVVDGRNLFPAIGYLFMAWETLSLISGVQISMMRVQFENCKFMRATTIPQKGSLKFTVSIQKKTGNFEITEDESLIVSGRIRIMDGNEPRENFVTGVSKADAQGPHLSSKDVYKELSLRGYDYKPNVFKPRKWDNIFLNSLHLMKILERDTRFLYVPTYIAKLTIDTQFHFRIMDQIPKKENEPIEIPVYSGRTTGIISCGSITISGLLANSINKRKNMAIPVLEKYKFMPNIVDLDIHSSIRVNVQIILENALIYKVKVVEVINEFTQENSVPLTPIIQSVIGDQPLVQAQVKILSNTALKVDENIEVEDKKLSGEQDCNIVIISNIVGRTNELEEAFNVLKGGGYVISREKPNCDISNNLFHNATIVTVHWTPTETILLLQKQNKYKEPLFIKVSSDNFTWLSAVQETFNKNSHQDIVLYSENEPLNGILGLVNCIRKEPRGKCVKCIFMGDKLKKFDPNEMQEQLKKHMAINIYKNGQWGTYRHLLLREELEPLMCEHAFVNVTTRGDLSSLRWIEGPLRHNMIVPLEKELVYVHYASLNFKDVVTASGKISTDVITPNRLEQECVQGFEFSGMDQRGRRVMGMTTHGALATMVLSDPQLNIEIPESWSLEQAATVPVVYGTVIYSMILPHRVRLESLVLDGLDEAAEMDIGKIASFARRNTYRGRLRRNETVLIHSGTGGIGQAAIRIALHYGYHHIGNSRNESFEHMILRETQGRGVDMVLNALVEDKLLASVRCLARGGRFLEIGKFDMANNSYLNTMLFKKRGLLSRSHHLKKGIREGAISPLDRTVFGYDEVEQAFRYMASGKHIGKVLVQVRKPEVAFEKLCKEFPCIPRYICDPEKTYVILGGLGGFGLELADWLVLRGAKKLVLASRKGISTGYQNLRTSTQLLTETEDDSERVRTWTSYGTIVKISVADISSKAGCEQLIEESQKLGSVDAIFNLAVVLADAFLEDQTPETFATCFAPKALATEYLDDITRELCPNLRQFVVFSSMSCGRGNAAQTNYGMANSIMERICERRRIAGYPALAVQWGAVGKVGLVAEMQGEKDKLDISGTLQQPISDCLKVLDTLLKQTESAIVSSMIVAEKREHKSANSVVDFIINILDLQDAKSVSFHATLPELGMDSITGVEIKQTLERDFDIFLTPKDFRTMTLTRLKERQEEKVGQMKNEQRGMTFLGLEDLIEHVELDADCCKPYIPLKSDQLENPSTAKVLLFPGLQADIIGMQFMYDYREQTIAEMAQSLLPYVEEHLTKDKPFNILTYSFGTLIALEVVSLLESQGYIGTILCIDGAPLLMKEMLQNVHGEIDQVLETAIISHLLTFSVPADVVSNNQEGIFKCATWEERLQQGADILKQHTGRETVYEEQFTTGIYMRLKALKEYSTSYSKLRSTVKLLKPKEEIVKDLPKDYGLSELFENPVEIQIFDGTHITILEDGELIDFINSYLNGDNLERR